MKRAIGQIRISILTEDDVELSDEEMDCVCDVLDDLDLHGVVRNFLNDRCPKEAARLVVRDPDSGVDF